MWFTNSWRIGLVAALVGSVSRAQTRIDGTIEGKVTDSQGLAMPGATVTVSSPALIQAFVVTTGPRAATARRSSPSARTRFGLRMTGFKTRALTGIDLPVGRVLVMNATLEPGGTAESVTVEAETPVIDTQQVKNVQTITKEVIDQLPLGRDPILGPTQLTGARCCRGYRLS